MWRYLKYLTTLVLILLVLGVFLYALPQTKQFGPWFAKLISSQSTLDIKFSDIQYTWRDSDTLIINNPKISTAQGETLLQADKVVIKVKTWSDFFDKTDLKLIYIENGLIDFTQLPTSNLITSESIQLKNVRYIDSIDDVHIKLTGLSAVISPWNSHDLKWLNSDAELNIYIKSAIIDHNQKSESDLSETEKKIVRNVFGDHFEMKNIRIDAKHLDNVWFINQSGFDWLAGSVALKGRIPKDGKWIIDELFIDNITRDFSFSFDNLFSFMPESIAFKDLTLTNSTFSGQNWNIDNVYLNAKNIALVGHDLSAFEQGKKGDHKVILSADKLNVLDLVLIEPDLSIQIAKNEIQIDKASVYLLNGLISIEGKYNPSDKALSLSNLTASNFNFTLQSLPESLIKISRALTSLQSLNIEILKFKNVSFQNIAQSLPWQIREMTLEGKNLTFSNKAHFELVSGVISGATNNFSLNSIDFIHGASFGLLANEHNMLFHDIKGATQTGVLEIPVLKVQRTTPTDFNIFMNGQSIEQHIFSKWYWPSMPLDESHGESVNFSAQFTGTLPDDINWFAVTNINKNDKGKEKTNDIVKLLNLSGAIEVTNTASHGLTHSRFSLSQTVSDGTIISADEKKQISVNALKNTFDVNREHGQLTELQQIEVSKKIYDKVDFLFNIYQTLLNDKIDIRLNKLKTDAFFVPNDLILGVPSTLPME